MDAVEYIKTLRRMCESNSDYSDCIKCPMRNKCSPIYEADSTESVAIVEKWAKDHPFETYKSHFLKAFPKANIWEGIPGLCRNVIYKGDCDCESVPDEGLDKTKCTACWNEPYNP